MQLTSTRVHILLIILPNLKVSNVVLYETFTWRDIMRTSTLACSLLSLALISPVWADSSQTSYPQAIYTASDSDSSSAGRDGKRHKKGAIHEKLKNMSDEERKAFHKEVKEKWNALSDEEKDAFKAKVRKHEEKREEKRLMRQYGAHLLMQQDKP